MLFLSELIEEKLQIITEATEGGKKNVFVEGIFLMGEQQNKNGRKYPMPVLENEVNRYTSELINNNRAWGELNHPSGPNINLDRVSHRIVSLNKENTNYVGKALITNTPMGDIVRGLLEAEGNLGVSSRGLGTLKANNGIMEVQNDFKLATAADIVADPSAHIAFVKGIMENVNWFFDAASGSWQAEKQIENIKKNVHENYKRLNGKDFLMMFESFVNTLK